MDKNEKLIAMDSLEDVKSELVGQLELEVNMQTNHLQLPPTWPSVR